MAATETRDGGVPEVRALARKIAAELQIQLQQMTVWTKA
jgi:uncharacterized protein (DUF305 family)